MGRFEANDLAINLAMSYSVGQVALVVELVKLTHWQ